MHPLLLRPPPPVTHIRTYVEITAKKKERKKKEREAGGGNEAKKCKIQLMNGAAALLIKLPQKNEQKWAQKFFRVQ